ncbi:hypothetical protein GF336_06520, partial [Candidatus Woesearchaeota archaeon]|nr:hypothetical protein [Candidatus Woesearchaeota archaeon]
MGRITKGNLIIICLLFGSALLFLSKLFQLYNHQIIYRVMLLMGFATFSFVAGIGLYSIHLRIMDFNEKLKEGENKFFQLLFKNQYFWQISLLSKLSVFLRLFFIILGLVFLLELIGFFPKFFSMVQINWFLAFLSLIPNIFLAYLGFLLFLTSIKSELDDDCFMIYIEKQLTTSRTNEEFNIYLPEYAKRLKFLSDYHKEHLETYYSLKFMEFYIKNFFYLPSLDLTTKKHLIKNVHKSLKGNYVNTISTLCEIDKVVRKKSERKYQNLILYLQEVYNFKGGKLFSILNNVCLTKKDKIKKFILAHDEITAFIIKSICGIILISVAVLISIQFPAIGNKILEFANTFS